MLDISKGNLTMSEADFSVMPALTSFMPPYINMHFYLSASIIVWIRLMNSVPANSQIK